MERGGEGRVGGGEGPVITKVEQEYGALLKILVDVKSTNQSQTSG